MNRRTGALFFASLCLAATAGMATTDAAAKWTRTTPWACHVIHGTALDTNWAMQSDSAVNELVALCPVLDTDYLRKQDITQVNVHVRDGHSGTYARAMLCEGNYVTAGGACSPPANSGTAFVGDVTLSPSTAAVWTAATAGYFGYIWVGVPRKSGASRSNIRGYWTSD
jgi:hypothetical protein